jgi:cysteine synthase A
MIKLYANNSQSVGNTPLVKLNRVTPAKANVFAKIEGRNPSYSVKCRIGVGMIDDAEQRGLLKPGGGIVEPTSGNTGIALASVAAARGYSITLTMPESMSLERRRVLAMFGANLVLTPAAEGMAGAIRKAEEILASDPEKYFMPQQFKNPANPRSHELTTGPEIWQDTEGDVDVIVSAVGTGGTLTGIARYLKKTKGKQITAIAVEPAESPVISQTLAKQTIKPGPHKIQGIGTGFIPETLDLGIVDRVETVESGVAIEYARRLAREEGMLSGISSGAAAAAAARIAEMDEFKAKNIVVILPDAGERYMSSALFEGI